LIEKEEIVFENNLIDKDKVKDAIEFCKAA